MKRLLESGVWLLVPGPNVEERSLGMAGASLLLAAFFALHGLFLDTPYFAPALSPSYGAPVDRPAVLLVATILLLFSVLHALPSDRRRARLSCRAALTLAVLAFLIWFPLARIEGYGVPVAALLVFALLCVNHYFNRRRALRLQDSPAD